MEKGSVHSNKSWPLKILDKVLRFSRMGETRVVTLLLF